MKSVIFLASQTSGTGSYWRIACALNEDRRLPSKYFQKMQRNIDADEIRRAIPPKTGHLLLFNHPPSLNLNMNVEDYDFIVNFRDPRDRLCNTYFWQFGHPTSEPEEQRQARISKVRSMGIDQWVLKQSNKSVIRRYYDNIFWLLGHKNLETYVVASYARLCCDIESAVKKVSTVVGTATTKEGLEKLALEMPENLGNNPDWIGNDWGGANCDLMPGRYKRELEPGTIEKLNEIYSDVLKNMARYDPDYAEYYLEGLN